MSRSRAFVFTINNPTDDDKPSLEAWKAQYLVYQLEQGENGTAHYQGYVYFKEAKTLTKMKKINGRAHWEVRRGSHDQAREYCMKEEGRLQGPFEEGEPPVQGKRTDVENLYADIKAGMSLKDLADTHTDAYMKFHKAVLHVKGLVYEKRTDKPQVIWYWGETGTGKTRKAFEDNPNAYFKDMSNGKWWDGYEQQECVIFDDMRKDTFKLHELLRILDRYPLQVEYKGGSIPFNSPKIIITSCYHPAKMYQTNENINQLLRRIDEVVEFRAMRPDVHVEELLPDAPLSLMDQINEEEAEALDGLVVDDPSGGTVDVNAAIMLSTPTIPEYVQAQKEGKSNPFARYRETVMYDEPDQSTKEGREQGIDLEVLRKRSKVYLETEAAIRNSVCDENDDNCLDRMIELLPKRKLDDGPSDRPFYKHKMFKKFGR